MVALSLKHSKKRSLEVQKFTELSHSLALRWTGSSRFGLSGACYILRPERSHEKTL